MKSELGCLLEDLSLPNMVTSSVLTSVRFSLCLYTGACPASIADVCFLHGSSLNRVEVYTKVSLDIISLND